MAPRPRLVVATVVATVVALGIAGAAVARAGPASDLTAARQSSADRNWAAAESLATRALRELESARTRDSLAMADALELIALARWRRVGYADGTGLAAASRALGIRERRPGTPPLDLASAHALVGRFLQGTGRADSALVHVRRALAIRVERLAPDDTLLADTWDQAALVQRDRRDFPAALDAWSHAIEIRTRAHGPEHPEIARLMGQTGVPWMELGELDRARTVLEASLAMFARTAGPDAPGRWTPLNILADVEGRGGNLAGNLDLLQEALRIVLIHFGDDSREAMTIRSNLSVALSNLGDFEGARAIGRSLLPRVEAQYGPSSPRTLQLRLGLALAARQLGDTVTATQQLRALESFVVANGGRPEALLSSALGQQAEILYWQKRDREALALNARARAIERGSRQPSLENLVLHEQIRIQILAATGDTAALDSARRDLQRVAANLPVSTAPQVSAAYWEAQAARRLGRHEEAWTRALDAERLSRERLRLNLRTLPDRRALALARSEDRYLDLVIDLARDRDPGHVRVAWDRLVRSRGAVRAEVARRSPPAALATDRAVLASLARRLDARRRLAQVTTSVGAARDSAARARLSEARVAADDAEQAHARLIAASGGAADTAEAGLAEVLARLEPGDALVACYAIGPLVDRNRYAGGPDGTLIALVARGGRDAIELVELGGFSELEASLAPWLERLAASPGPGARLGSRAERECRDRGRAVRALTWDRLAGAIAGATHVYLVADGPLLALPWHALPDGRDRYLVETGPRLQPLHAERELVETVPSIASTSLLAVGAPDYDLGGEKPAPELLATRFRPAPDPCARTASARLAELPGSGLEAEAVVRAWRGAPGHRAIALRGAEATEAAFKRMAPGCTVLHLATHGVVAEDTCRAATPGTRGIGTSVPVQPAASTPPQAGRASPRRAPSPWAPRRVWIALAGANHAREHTADENEGLLTAEEVLTLDLSGTDWVVLSACHAGAAERWSREGALGMRRAFDLAGVRTVIASDWAVEDAATQEWMVALYAARSRGETAAVALQSASREALAARRNGARSTHPFYWAAFRASGR